MAKTRYEELQGLTKKSGEATWAFYQKVKAVSPKIEADTALCKGFSLI